MIGPDPLGNAIEQTVNWRGGRQPKARDVPSGGDAIMGLEREHRTSAWSSKRLSVFCNSCSQKQTTMNRPGDRDLGTLGGKPVRLRFTLKDAGMLALQFRS